MKKTFLCLTLILLAGCNGESEPPVPTGGKTGLRGTTASTTSAICRIADASNRNEVSVPVIVQNGEQNDPPRVVMYRGHRVSALLQGGDSAHPGLNLLLTVDAGSARLYQGADGSNLQLVGSDYLFQCALESR